MSTNPVFDFYAKLRVLIGQSSQMDSETRSKWVLEVISLYYSAQEKISLPEVSPLAFSYWLADLNNNRVCDDTPNPDVWWNKGVDGKEDVAVHAFEDLSGQMRNTKVVRLIRDLKVQAGILTDLFIAIRRKKALPIGAGSITLVVDDLNLFNRFLEDLEGSRESLVRSTTLVRNNNAQRL